MARGEFLKAELLNQPFALCPAKMQTYMNVLNEGAIRTEQVGVSNNNVVYTKAGNVAVVSLDGAMYKKSFSGACGESVVAYPDIVGAIDKAESDETVDTILFRVDTGGGSVAGAEEVRFRIKNSTKKTITFYENLGASGGIWIFTASDEIYAAPTTWLGSIGVVVAYEETDPDTKNKKVELVSKSAPNKRCNLNGDCKEKMQMMIDEIEKDFFMVLKENTGFEQEKLMEIFQNGGIIKAEVAKDYGFIKDIRQFSVLLSTLKSNIGASMQETVDANISDINAIVDESVSSEVVAVEDNVIIGGFAFNEENFTTLVESRAKAQETIKALNTNIADIQGQLEGSNNIITNIENRISMALSFNVSDEKVISNMILASTDEEATAMGIECKDDSSISIGANDGSIQSDAEKEANEIAYAKAYASNLR